MAGNIKEAIKKIWAGRTEEKQFIGDKIFGFRALLSTDGRYRFDIDIKGCNLSQLGILTLLHQRIGDELKANVKETAIRDNDKWSSREDEDGN